MDLEKVVKEKFAEVVSSGFVEEQIKNMLQQTVKHAIEQSLKSYSDFGKTVEKAISEAINLKNLDFPEYNQLVSNWVREIVDRSMISVGKAQIEANLKTFFQPLEKSEWKASEIAQQFIESLKEDSPGDSGEIAFIIDTKNSSDICSDYWAIYMDEDRKKERFRCKYQIHINKTGVWRVEIDGSDSREMKSICLHGFEEFLFKLYATKAMIIDDDNNVETSWSYED